jgi:two-component system cell cycle response regulator CtrA
MLESENYRLSERIAFLEDALAPRAIDIPLEWRLTASEVRVFRAMCARELATKETLMAALYSNRPDNEPEMKIIDVFICKLRHKVKHYGVEIRTHWGQGWSIDAETRMRLKGDAR